MRPQACRSGRRHSLSGNSALAGKTDQAMIISTLVRERAAFEECRLALNGLPHDDLPT
jgi:hypothetical protein